MAPRLAPSILYLVILLIRTSSLTLSAVSHFKNTAGFGPLYLNFTTGDLPEAYPSSSAIRVALSYSSFAVANDCGDVVDAAGGLPALVSCAFTSSESVLNLIGPVSASSTYSLTLNMILPSSELLDGLNELTLSVESRDGTVETASTMIAGAIRTSATASAPSVSNGYIREFKLVSMDAWLPNQSINFVFAITSSGTMNNRFAIDVTAYPPNLWNFGIPESPCAEYNTLRLVSGSACTLKSFPGASLPTASNGFRIQIDTPYATDLADTQFRIRLTAASSPCSGRWVASSSRVTTDPGSAPAFALLNDTINIFGAPNGGVTELLTPAIGASNSVLLSLNTGVSLIKAVSSPGYVDIYPPTGFTPLAGASAVPGLAALPVSWSVVSNQYWRGIATTATIFGSTNYVVRLPVTNRATASGAVGWSCKVSRGTELLSAGNGIRGFAVVKTMQLMILQSTQLAGALADLWVRVVPTTDLGRAVNAQLRLVAPLGFLFPKACKLRPILNFPIEEVNCRGDNANLAVFTFPRIGSIQANVPVEFSIVVTNPSVSSPASDWFANSAYPDGRLENVATTSGYETFDSQLPALFITPSSRAVGTRTILIEFNVASTTSLGDVFQVRAPDGIIFQGQAVTTGLTSAVDSGAALTDFASSVVSASGATLRISANEALRPSINYGVAATVTVPSLTPAPNVWWLEQYRTTDRIASASTAGFKTLVLGEVRLLPFNPVAEAWNNPLTITFSTTAPASVLTVTAPTGFAFLCPVSDYGSAATVRVIGETFQPLPVPTQCTVQPSRLNILKIGVPAFTTGTTYGFIVQATNPASTLAGTNFQLETSTADGVAVESGAAQGFNLAAAMYRTRYYSVPTREDRRSSAASNSVTLVLGITSTLPSNSVLSISTPSGFSLARDAAGSCTVDAAAYLGSGFATFPTGQRCSSPAGRPETASITLSSGLSSGNYGVRVLASNPARTPEFNYWSVVISDSSGTALMAEAWIEGFAIQELSSVSIYPYNPATAVATESAPNLIDIVFSTSTALLTGSKVTANAPLGFSFPEICEGFTGNLGSPVSLITASACIGTGRTLSITLSGALPVGTYGFRVTVNNPSFVLLAGAALWSLRTTLADGTVVDADDSIPTFPVYPRARYFSVSALSDVGGAETAVLMTFALNSPLPPKSSVTVVAPQGVILTPGDCASDQSSLRQLFGPGLIAGSGPLPSYVNCLILDDRTIQMQNTEPVRRGRMLPAGSTYEQVVAGVTSPDSSPSLNIWRMSATTADGTEVWATTGYVVYPELPEATVSSSNPGKGLYTDFAFTLTTVSQTAGSILVRSPEDSFYFGPRIASQADPLSSEPLPSGQSVISPMGTHDCSVSAPETGVVICPLSFVACDSGRTAACTSLQLRCQAGDFQSTDPLTSSPAILSCDASPGSFELVFGTETYLAPGARFSFKVSGYNGKILKAGSWRFVTRDSDSAMTVLDRKTIQTASPLGVIFVDYMRPSETQVSLTGNLVTVQLRLTTTAPQPARLSVTFPSAFDSDSVFILGSGFPARVQSRISGNQIQLDSLLDPLPKDTNLTFTVGLTNPQISPIENTWVFETISLAPATLYDKIDVNYDVTGFKVFGGIKTASLAPRSRSPGVSTRVGVWLTLESDLPWDQNDPDSKINIYFPIGFQPVDGVCGRTLFSTSFTPASDAEVVFPVDRTFTGIPAGSLCTSVLDPATGRTRITIATDETLHFGVDYAFGIGVTNPLSSPAANSLTVLTTISGVVLHLKKAVPGYDLRLLKQAEISLSDSGSLAVGNKLQFNLSSARVIPASSVITILAPVGFVFTCAGVDFRIIAQTTTCVVQGGNRVVFGMDSENTILANTVFGITIYVTNPRYTPQPNKWSIRIFSGSGVCVDINNEIPGFDITGGILASVIPQFTYKLHKHILTVKVKPSTIMNRADNGNALVVTAPKGFVFPVTCVGFSFRILSGEDGEPVDASFPPTGTACEAFGNETVIVNLPFGYGLTPAWYRLTVAVVNAASNPGNVAQSWLVKTTVLGRKTVDWNATVAGFSVTDLTIKAVDSSAIGWKLSIICLAILACLVL